MRHTTRCAGPSATPQLIPISTAAATEQVVWARNLVYFSPYSLYFYLIISDRLFHENIDVEQVHFFAISLLFYFKIWEVSRLKLDRDFSGALCASTTGLCRFKDCTHCFEIFWFLCLWWFTSVYAALQHIAVYCHSYIDSVVSVCVSVWQIESCKTAEPIVMPSVMGTS